MQTGSTHRPRARGASDGQVHVLRRSLPRPAEEGPDEESERERELVRELFSRPMIRQGLRQRSGTYKTQQCECVVALEAEDQPSWQLISECPLHTTARQRAESREPATRTDEVVRWTQWLYDLWAPAFLVTAPAIDHVKVALRVAQAKRSQQDS